jgi:phosphoribosyl 1,2-cyclic phosphate phosphodiesterase
MRIRFLGTSAGELYPGMWCRCANCAAARASDDPRDRRQSATVAVYPTGTDGDPAGLTLIDFPPEIASQCERHGVDLTRLERLLVTHSHGDHWFPYLLRWRARPAVVTETPPVSVGAPRFTPLPALPVYGNAAVEAVLRRELGDHLEAYDLAFVPVAAGGRFTAGHLAVTPLAANHDVGREDVVHYALTAPDGATVLYGLDGDTFLPETRAALRDFRFDVVIMESTYGLGAGRNHRNFARVVEEAAWFRDEGLMKPGGRIIATHFSPHHCPPHAETAALLAAHGVEAAYDGLEIGVGELPA